MTSADAVFSPSSKSISFIRSPKLICDSTKETGADGMNVQLENKYEETLTSKELLMQLKQMEIERDEARREARKAKADLALIETERMALENELRDEISQLSLQLQESKSESRMIRQDIDVLWDEYSILEVRLQKVLREARHAEIIKLREEHELNFLKSDESKPLERTGSFVDRMRQKMDLRKNTGNIILEPFVDKEKP